MRVLGFLRITLVLVHFVHGFDQAKAGSSADTAKTARNMQENRVVLVTEQKQVWINCQATQPNQSLPPGFCERLLADFAKITGQVVNTNIAVPDGMIGMIVLVDQTAGHRAAITLIAGKGQNGGFMEKNRQDMRLGGVDATLQAGAAQALVFPMVGLLAAID